MGQTENIENNTSQTEDSAADILSKQVTNTVIRRILLMINFTVLIDVLLGEKFSSA